MAARYMFHGLRLPTDGIEFKHASIGDGQAVRGLYELTGQQFPIPLPVEDERFSFALSREDGPNRVLFPEAANATELRFEVDETESRRIEAVCKAASEDGICPDLGRLGVRTASGTRPATFALRSMIRWQSPEQVALPYGAGSDQQELRIWWLPGGISALAERAADEEAGPSLPPRFSVQIATYDDVTARMVQQPSAAYAFWHSDRCGRQEDLGPGPKSRGPLLVPADRCRRKRDRPPGTLAPRPRSGVAAPARLWSARSGMPAPLRGASARPAQPAPPVRRSQRRVRPLCGLSAGPAAAQGAA